MSRPRRPKKRTGRPPLAPGLARKFKISCLVTADEKRAIEASARARYGSDGKVSEFIRERVLSPDAVGGE
jgi:hypothetical protein